MQAELYGIMHAIFNRFADGAGPARAAAAQR